MTQTELIAELEECLLDARESVDNALLDPAAEQTRLEAAETLRDCLPPILALIAVIHPDTSLTS